LKPTSCAISKKPKKNWFATSLPLLRVRHPVRGGGFRRLMESPHVNFPPPNCPPIKKFSALRRRVWPRCLADFVGGKGAVGSVANPTASEPGGWGLWGVVLLRHKSPTAPHAGHNDKVALDLRRRCGQDHKYKRLPSPPKPRRGCVAQAPPRGAERRPLLIMREVGSG